MIWHFLEILVFRKTHLFFKLIFRAIQLQQRPKYDIFQKALLCTLASNTNFGWNAVPIAVGRYIWRDSTFFTKNWSFLEFQCIFKELKTKRKIFRQSWTKYLETFHFLAKFLFTINKTELEYYHQNMSVRVTSRVGS